MPRNRERGPEIGVPEEEAKEKATTEAEITEEKKGEEGEALKERKKRLQEIWDRVVQESASSGREIPRRLIHAQLEKGDELRKEEERLKGEKEPVKEKEEEERIEALRREIEEV